jgi:hypothetical protein
MSTWHQITYTDELLADRTVHRRYSDGRQEWRRQVSPGVVQWRDDRGQDGTDELLGRNILKRSYQDGYRLYGRDLSYGRTAWTHHPGHGRSAASGGRVLTMNRTSFGGRIGAILAGIGAGALLGPLIPPPVTLTLAQEEELRRAAAQRSGSDGGGNDDGSGDWNDERRGGDLDDFG